MRVLVEGEKYDLDLLESIFDDSKFYSQNGCKGIIKYVGYYNSFERNEIVYFLPKVFMNAGLVFGKYDAEMLAIKNIHQNIKHPVELMWIRKLLVYFYNSLSIFRKKFSDNLILESSQTFDLNTNIGSTEYSYLDLLLSFVNYYKKNKNSILYHHIEHISDLIRKPKWESTVRNTQPILVNGNNPIYLEVRNKRKTINLEEELLTYFFSILNYFNEEHQLNLKIDKSYSIITGIKFKLLQKNGLTKIRKIKYRYFSDSLKRMYQLCELYFSITDISSIKRKKEEFISVKNYNIIFEDMIDRLFSDSLDDSIKVDEFSLSDLKYNKDGKIIDHLYEHQSLIDTSNIFYIGDSKYYKSDSEAGELSKYKQFTYAKNIIQFNIDFLNTNNEYYKKNLRYRDTEITEGYNISPNFFLYGFISNLSDFDYPAIEPYKKPKKSYHFEDRLFDRDTLFVHQYKINFLFVLKSYSQLDNKKLFDFRKSTRKYFRDNLLLFFNNREESGFEIYERIFEEAELKSFVNENFRELNGKCISINNQRLVIARYNEDKSLDTLLQNFSVRMLV